MYTAGSSSPDGGFDKSVRHVLADAGGSSASRHNDNRQNVPHRMGSMGQAK